LLQQQLEQANETIATLMEQMTRIQEEASQLFIVLLGVFCMCHSLSQCGHYDINSNNSYTVTLITPWIYYTGASFNTVTQSRKLVTLVMTAQTMSFRYELACKGRSTEKAQGLVT